MSAESTSTTEHDRATGHPGEGAAGGPHEGVPAVGRTVTKPSTPAPGGRAAEHFRGAVAAGHQLMVARTWLQRGHPLIPCSKRTKKPLINGFGAGDDITPCYDSAQVRQWFEVDFPGAHVGLLTRHVLVVDCDMPKEPDEFRGRFADCRDGTDVLALRLADIGADWPTTYTVLTPGGGVHLFFLQREDEPIGCRTGTGRKDKDADPAPGHIGPRVDVRGVGGYVIAPGSYSTAQGRPYERISPPGTDIAPVPESILQLVRRPAAAPVPARPTPVPVQYGRRADRYAEQALAGAADDVRSAPAGEGNRMLFARARRMGELAHTAPRVLTAEEVERRLVAAALDRGRDWTETEARRTVRSGWTKGVAA